MRHGPTFWKELPEQSVAVFVRASLLRAVHVREVHPTFQCTLDPLMPPKLRSVVARDCLYRQAGEGSDDLCGDRIRVDRRELPKDAKAH